MDPVVDGIAVMIGCNYANTDTALAGCFNDARKMADIASRSPLFRDDVRLYTSNEQTGEYLIGEIKRAISRKPQYLWIHFSGHGQSVPDSSGIPDETDGFDEAIVIGDKESVTLTDDVLSELLRTAAATTRILFTSDSCHSGSILDLPYIHTLENDMVKTVLVHYTMPSPCIVCISGCEDAQYSYETVANSQPGGEFTRCLSAFLGDKELHRILLEDVMEYLQVSFRNKKQSPVVSTSFQINHLTTLL
jgi:hypothetical protein